MARRFILGAFVSLPLTIASLAGADTNVGGPIFADVTWTLAGSPYVVTNSIIVGSGATLTIDPGVVVKVGSGLGIQIGSPEGFGPGAIVAQGTVGQPIRFTSNQPAGSETPGSWNNILFTASAIDAVYDGGGAYVSGSILEHAIVEFAGGGNTSTGGVTVLQSAPFFNFVEIRDCARTGLRIDGSTAPAQKITNCQIHDCVGNGQSGGGLFLVNAIGHTVSGCVFQDNAASSNGGGAYLQAVGNIDFSDNVLVGNSAGNGAGLFATQTTSPVFADLVFTGNGANSSYGGMYADGSSVQLLDSTFDANTSFNWAAFYVTSNSAVVSGNTFSGNTAAGTGGGGHADGTGIEVTDNEWTDNTANNIGGFDVSGSGVMFSGNMLVGNQSIQASGNAGGLNINGSNGVYSGNTVSDNTVQNFGGGIYVSGSGHMFDTNVVDSNFAGSRGGGVYLAATNTTWSDNDLTSNECEGLGGGVFVAAAGVDFSGPPDQSTCNTISGNTAPLGSAIYNDLKFLDNGGGNVDASFVCWGTTNPATIAASLYDYFDNATKGLILAAPLVGGPMTVDTTWDLAGSPYTLQESMIIGNGATLTIEAGVEVRFAANTAITVGSDPFGDGTLVARGSLAQPIRFTTAEAGPPQPGSWKGIAFSPYAADAVYDGGGAYVSGSILEHAIVEFAGGGNTSTGGVTVLQSAPFFNFVEIRDCARTGLRIDGSTAPAQKITNCQIHDCVGNGQSGGGLFLVNAIGHTVSGCVFQDNAASSNGGGAYLQAVGNIDFSDNVLVGNSAGNGAGLFATQTTSPVFADLVFTGNGANSSYGGMYADGSSVQLLDSTFDANTSFNWAAFYVTSNSAVVSGNTFSGNTAAGTGGGGHADGTGIEVTDNEWTDNTANNIGGFDVSGSGVMFSGNMLVGNQSIQASGNAGGLNINGSNGVYSGNTVSDNTVQNFGGGIYVSGSGHMFDTNVVDSNFAGSRGGGVYLAATNTTWSDNDLTSNEAGSQGGAIYNTATGTSIAGVEMSGIYNTIVGNVAPQGSAIYHNVANGTNGNLPAQYVCWGTNDQQVVQGMLWDFFDNSSLGIVFTFPLVEDCKSGPECPADISGDGVVDGSDLGLLLGAWGTNDPAADIDGSGMVDGADLGILLGSWGPCP